MRLLQLGCICLSLAVASVALPQNQVQIASYYSIQHHGKLTASGEIYNMNALTCAHRILPFNTKVKIINLRNNKSVILRVNDRGPYHKNKAGEYDREVDVSFKAAQDLYFVNAGLTEIKLEVIDG